MNEFNEATAENLRFLRGARGMTQDEVAALLGIERHTVSKIENARRELSASEKTLLDWFFFGQVPPRLLSQGDDLRGVLEFTEEEFRVIRLLATRDGVRDPKKWIAAKIRSYLAYESEAHRPSLKVAEEPRGYQSWKTKKLGE